MSPQKIGRPTDNPKGQSIHIRLDAGTKTILDKYQEQEQVSRAQAVRIAIGKLENDLKK